MAAAPRYATEAALCADFIDEVRKTGKWEAYAETGGWDILLVRLADGFQIGVSAKLRFNAKVVAQALEYSSYEVDYPGPDCRAVLVPNGDGDLSGLCKYIGVVVIVLQPEPERGVICRRIEPALPDEDRRWGDRWPEWAPVKRCPLPEYVPDCAAGASAPLRLTAWKIGAIKLAIILETRPLTRADFKVIGIDHRRWLPSAAGWLQLAPNGGGWIAGPGLPDFKRQHPANYEQIKADVAKWMPPATLLAPRQADLVFPPSSPVPQPSAAS